MLPEQPLVAALNFIMTNAKNIHSSSDKTMRVIGMMLADKAALVAQASEQINLNELGDFHFVKPILQRLTKRCAQYTKFYGRAAGSGAAISIIRWTDIEVWNKIIGQLRQELKTALEKLEPARCSPENLALSNPGLKDALLRVLAATTELHTEACRLMFSHRNSLAPRLERPTEVPAKFLVPRNLRAESDDRDDNAKRNKDSRSWVLRQERRWGLF